MRLIEVVILLIVVTTLIPLTQINTYVIFGEKDYISQVKPPHVYVTRGEKFLLYLVRGDEIIFQYQFMDVSSWCIRLDVTYLAYNKSYSYNDCGVIEKPITPKFIAPFTGLYELITETYGEGGRIEFKFSLKAISINERYSYYIPKALAVIIVALLILLINYLVGIKRRVIKILALFTMELKSFGLHYLMFLIGLTMLLLNRYTFSILVSLGSLSFPPLPGMRSEFSSDTYSKILYSAMFNYGNAPLIWFLYFIYVIVVTSVLITYENELKITRNKFILGFSKVRLFLIKLLAIAVLSLLPLLIPHLILMSIANTELLFSKPLFFLKLLGCRVFADLSILIMCLSFVILPALLPKLMYSILVSLSIGMLFLRFKPELQVSAFNLINSVNNRYALEIIEFHLPLLIASIIIAIIVMRFKDYG